MRIPTTTLLLASLVGLVGCGGLELGGVTDDASDLDILSEEQAEEQAEAEIDDANLEEQLDDLMSEIEADEASDS